MESVALIGFGEAGAAFAPGLSGNAIPRAYDRQTDDPSRADAKRADYAAARVTGCKTMAEALEGAAAALSLVTADQSLAAARQAASALRAGTFWFDMNSVAPQTKRETAAVIAQAGGRPVDVAVMAPVHPARVAVPLLASGPYADEGAAMLRRMGFTDVRVVAGDIGRASAIKMIRSVMVKGIEALTAECFIAASAAGVLDEVAASLDASPPPPEWKARADYNFDRMLVHGLRRAAEMEEVVKTLDALGAGSIMSRGTVERQRQVGELGCSHPPSGLDAKLAAFSRFRNIA